MVAVPIDDVRAVPPGRIVRDDRHVHGTRVWVQRQAVDRDVAGCGGECVVRRMPRTVEDSPLIEAHGGRVDLSRAVPVGEANPCLPPSPGGEVRAPFLSSLTARARGGAGMPEGAELVAVGVGGIGPVANLAPGDRHDTLAQTQASETCATWQLVDAPSRSSVEAHRDDDAHDDEGPEQEPAPAGPAKSTRPVDRRS